MKKVDVVNISKSAIAQTLGEEYMEKAGEITGLNSQELVDAGKAIDAVDGWSAVAINAVSLLGKHIIDAREYNSRLPQLYIDAFDWGGYLERTRFGLADIMQDPMYNLVSGQSYADIEHTYYNIEADTKIYEEAKPIMTPLSIVREQLKDAFKSWDDMGRWLSGKQQAVRNTLNIGLMVYEKMLISCAMAVSDLKTGSAVHLITEAKAQGILEEGDNYNFENYLTMPAAKLDKFLPFMAKRISEIRSYMYEPSTAYNDGTVPTWSVDDPELIMLTAFERDIRFNLRAGTYNKDDVSFGEYNTITSWQGIREDEGAENFNRVAVSTINIGASASNKLGIGTEAYNKSNAVALLYDFKAIGISLMRNKVTSQYTACADFWNEFHHVLVNYILDSSYGIVGFFMD